jgi:hypothetical protein
MLLGQVQRFLLWPRIPFTGQTYSRRGQVRKARTAHIFEIANLASQDKCCNPGPVNSTTLSAATVFRFSCCKMYRIVSLPPIPGLREFIRRIFTLSGTLNQVCPVISGIVTSEAPRPMARAPTEPAEQVCESEPMTIMPGWARSR